jgi:hypothetical protein
MTTQLTVPTTGHDVDTEAYLPQSNPRIAVGTGARLAGACDVETIIDLHRNSAALCAVATIWERQRFRRIAPEPPRACHDHRPAQIDDRVQSWLPSPSGRIAKGRADLAAADPVAGGAHNWLKPPVAPATLMSTAHARSLRRRSCPGPSSGTLRRTTPRTSAVFASLGTSSHRCTMASVPARISHRRIPPGSPPDRPPSRTRATSRHGSLERNEARLIVGALSNRAFHLRTARDVQPTVRAISSVPCPSCA